MASFNFPCLNELRSFDDLFDKIVLYRERPMHRIYLIKHIRKCKEMFHALNVSVDIPSRTEKKDVSVLNRIPAYKYSVLFIDYRYASGCMSGDVYDAKRSVSQINNIPS